MRGLAVPLGLALLALSPDAAAQEASASDPCRGSSTPEINTCYGNKLKAAEAEMARYLQAAISRYLEAKEDAVVLGLRQSQTAFEAYREIECATVYEYWATGTIRGLQDLTCRIALTDQRTRAIWAQWLTFPDGSPPTLPEPKPTE